MELALAWLAKPFGKIAIVIGAILSFWTALEINNYFQRKGARTTVVSEINIKAEKQVDAAIKARAPALRPGSFDRLRRDSCYDC